MEYLPGKKKTEEIGNLSCSSVNTEGRHITSNMEGNSYFSKPGFQSRPYPNRCLLDTSTKEFVNSLGQVRSTAGGLRSADMFLHHHLFLPRRSSRLRDGTIRYASPFFSRVSMEHPLLTWHVSKFAVVTQRRHLQPTFRVSTGLHPIPPGRIHPRFCAQYLNLGIFFLKCMFPLQSCCVLGAEHVGAIPTGRQSREADWTIAPYKRAPANHARGSNGP
jgi:hypothetical protein